MSGFDIFWTPKGSGGLLFNGPLWVHPLWSTSGPGMRRVQDPYIAYIDHSMGHHMDPILTPF